MKAAEITSCFVVLQELQQGMQWGLAPQQEYLVGPSYSLSHSMQFGRSRNTQHVAARHAQVRQTERAYTRAYVRASLTIRDGSGWRGRKRSKGGLRRGTHIPGYVQTQT